MPLSSLFALFILAGLIYVLPTTITAVRGHRNFHKLAKLNLLLGWTVVGWFAALRQALGPRQRRTSDLDEWEVREWWSFS